MGAFFCPRARAKKPGFPLQVLGKRQCAFLRAFRSNPSRIGSLRTSSRNCHGNSGADNCLWQLSARNPAGAILPMPK
jgi:hypothetical protein